MINEVIRFTERLLNMALTSSKDLALVLDSLFFYSWVSSLLDSKYLKLLMYNCFYTYPSSLM